MLTPSKTSWRFASHVTENSRSLTSEWRARGGENRTPGSEGGGWKRVPRGSQAVGRLSLPSHYRLINEPRHKPGHPDRTPRQPPTHLVDTATGEARYDNFGGSWGDPKQLDRFMQIYAVERAKLEARKRGHSVSEQ